MFKPEDIRQIEGRGIRLESVEKQIANFKTGFPFLRLIETASLKNGLYQMSTDEIEECIACFEKNISQGLAVQKFVPASGAASRMFKTLFLALDQLKSGHEFTEIIKEKEIALFFDKVSQFAFYDDLKILISETGKSIENTSHQDLLELVLLEKGLNYANLPKALLKFHRYQGESRTAIEEHFVEGALYSKDKKGTVRLHFTVSPEHLEALKKHTADIKAKYGQKFGVRYLVSFSQQKKSTDIIAVDTGNQPFRDSDGSLFFSPAGHGALLENLNDIEADLIFIKNIDNVSAEQLSGPTIVYKKALAGLLLQLQEKIFYYQKMLREHEPDALGSDFYTSAGHFLKNILKITPPASFTSNNKNELHHYLMTKFNRPLRVCGMVKNLGEPGGGPFFSQNPDGSVSLQIVESSQIDFNNPEQLSLVKNATHFNPVDLVCGVKNYSGEKFNLLKFTDPETGFISRKSRAGREMKIQELPGLWNGSMSDWNTLFVEVPVITFNPVKTITDLLRDEHQAKK